jgi:hypothetical protein
VERRDVKLPNLGHGLERFAAERVRVGGNAAPTEDAEALRIGGGFNSGARFVRRGGREKCETEAENFGEVDALLFGTGAKEFVRERSQKACAVAAGTIGIDATAMGETLESGEGDIYNFVAGGAPEARNEPGTTGVVVGMAPVWVPIAAGWHAPKVHTCLLSWWGEDVQRRICI